MAKKCEYFKICFGKKTKFYDGCGNCPYPCPKNTNSECEITPQKNNMIQVKAWAWPSFGAGGINTSAKHLIGISFVGGQKGCEVPCIINLTKANFRKIGARK